MAESARVENLFIPINPNSLDTIFTINHENKKNSIKKHGRNILDQITFFVFII
ncbi:hypothetical protein TUM3811_06900 [Shewanella algae]|nr:hypothetical protein TUM3811_06900 [Shewanella algae]